jgi:hypothetical protein
MDGIFAPRFTTPESGLRPLLRRIRSMLTARNFALATGIGFALGVVQAIGRLLYLKGPFWTIALDPIVPAVAQGAFLLLALAVAASVQPVRAPRWLPFAIAAVVATVCAGAIDWLWGYIVQTLRGLEFNPTSLQVATYAWQETPFRLTVSVFAMLAAMQAADVARRDRALRRLQMEQARVTRATYEARLTALQARVEPRFLFETLSDVEGLYDRDPGLGAQVMDELIVYLRAALPTIDDTSSSLEIELVLVRNWLDIMRVRSGDHLTFAVTEEAPPDARLPPMLLLPLVQHACEDGPDQTRGVFVETARAGDRIRITVIGPACAFAPSKPSAAVDAVRDRIDVLFGDTGTLLLQPVLHDRSQAILDIPYERTDRRPR